MPQRSRRRRAPRRVARAARARDATLASIFSSPICDDEAAEERRVDASRPGCGVWPVRRSTARGELARAAPSTAGRRCVTWTSTMLALQPVLAAVGARRPPARRPRRPLRRITCSASTRRSLALPRSSRSSAAGASLGVDQRAREEARRSSRRRRSSQRDQRPAARRAASSASARLRGEVEHRIRRRPARPRPALLEVVVRHVPLSADVARAALAELGDRLGDQPLVVLGLESRCCRIRPASVGGRARGHRVELLDRGLLGDPDLALGALDASRSASSLRLLLDPALDGLGVAPRLVDDRGRLGAGGVQLVGVLLEPRLGLARGRALRLGERLADELLALLEARRGSAPRRTCRGRRPRAEDHQGPDRVADVAGEDAAGARPPSRPSAGAASEAPWPSEQVRSVSCRLPRTGSTRVVGPDSRDRSSRLLRGPPGGRRRPRTARRPRSCAAVTIIAVLIWPAISGWRAIDSTAEPPTRPMPMPAPITARPAPIAPPSLASAFGGGRGRRRAAVRPGRRPPGRSIRAKPTTSQGEDQPSL